MPSLNFSVFVDKVELGLREPKNPLGKRQTIRKIRVLKGKPHPIKLGDPLYLFTGMRTKNCRRLNLNPEKCVETFFLNMVFYPNGTFKDSVDPVWRVDMFKALDGSMGSLTLTDTMLEDIAKRDGFDSTLNMLKWFYSTHEAVIASAPFRITPDFQLIRW